MTPIELAREAMAIAQLLSNVLSMLQRLRGEDVELALSSGYDGNSLHIGALDQWIYVLQVRKAADPSSGSLEVASAPPGALSAYLCALVDDVLSDDRFVGEIDLRWSPIWRRRAGREWERAIEAAMAIRSALPRSEREAFLARGLAEDARQPYKDGP